MNWLFGKTKSNLPEPTALQTQKSKQIEQLKTFNQNVTEIHRDVEYRVNFVVNGCPTSLYITLPPQFPQDKPLVKVAPPLRHPWVNDQMLVTGSSELSNFMMHSDLGKVIRHIVEEFQKTPPVFLPANQQAQFGGGMAAPPPYPLHPPGGLPGQPPQLPSYTPYSQPPTSFMPSIPHPTLPPSSFQQQQQQQVAPVSAVPSAAAPATTGGGVLPTPATCMVAPAVVPPASVSATPAFQPPATSALHQDLNAQMLHSSHTTGGNYQTPEMPLSFPQLLDLSTSDLRSLSDDEDRLLQLVMELPQLSKIAGDRQHICEKNEQLAKNNMLIKPMLEEKKRILLEKYDELNDVRRTFDERAERQDALRGAYDPAALQLKLRDAAQEADVEAEAVAESFMDGKLNVQEFSKTFLQKKALAHLRKSKEEKLSQYIFQSRPF